MARKVIDDVRFLDQSRYWSPELTRAFASVIRAVSKSPQSEVLEPEEVVVPSDIDIVRRVD